MKGGTTMGFEMDDVLMGSITATEIEMCKIGGTWYTNICGSSTTLPLG
jgi:hypothetical protein